MERIEDLEFKGKQVLVRGDLDVEDADNPRTDSLRKLLDWIGQKNPSRIKVIGHRETEFLICEQLRREYGGIEFDDQLRANPGEKANDEKFSRELAEGFEIYINEAFATSHRRHASIVGVPKEIKAKGGQVAMGMRFVKELERLNQVNEMLRVSGDGAVLVIGGTKVDDKQRFIELMGNRFGQVLVGGLLPNTERRSDGLDLSDVAIERYKKAIVEARLILAAGVMGKYEDESASNGTREVLQAIAGNKGAYKVAGGGDIETAISKYGLTDKFDWISVGGGAMLEYLQSGTLAGLEAVRA